MHEYFPYMSNWPQFLGTSGIHELPVIVLFLLKWIQFLSEISMMIKGGQNDFKNKGGGLSKVHESGVSNGI